MHLAPRDSEWGPPVVACEGILGCNERNWGLLHLEGGHCLGLPCTEFNGGGTDLQATSRGMLEVIEPRAARHLEADHSQDELVQQGDSPLIRARSTL